MNILDSSAMGLGYDETVEILSDRKPDVVGISALTATSKEAYTLAERIKKHLGATVILGGAHPTSFPEEIFKQSQHTDIVVLGEGEDITIKLIRALEQKDDLAGVEGIWWRDSAGRVIKNAPPKFTNNLDEIPFPARHLYKNELYMPLPNQSRRLPATNMITSRGCPYARCLFFFQGGEYACKYRRRSPENVIKEIKWLVKDFGFKEIAFWDDNFAVNTRWVLEFCRLLEEEHIDITWSCCARVDTVTEPMLKRMGQCGCFSIYYGFESGNQDILEKLNKGVTLEVTRRAVKWTHAAGIETRGSFMLSLPGENPEKGRKTIDFAIELDLDSVQFMPFHPMKGTKFYSVAETEGKELDYPEGGVHAVSYIPDGYSSAGEVARLVRTAYKRFYLRPHYIFKNIRKIKNFSDLKKYFDGFKFFVGIIS